MKQYFDITQSTKANTVLQVCSNACLQPEEVLSIGQSLIGSTYVYLPVSGESPANLDAVFSGRFFSKAWVIYLDTLEPGDVLTCDILGKVEDLLVSGDSIIIRTGWSRYLGTPHLYNDKFPTIGTDLAEWFVRKQVNTVLVDMPFLANVNYMPEFLELYSILAKGNILTVCGAQNLDILNFSSVKLVIMPLKIKETNLSLVRAIAINE